MDGEMDLKSLFKQAEGIQDRLRHLERDLLSLETAGESGGGMVQVRLDGNYGILSLDISDQAYDEGREVLAELIVAAMGDATDKMHEMRRKKQNELLGVGEWLNPLTR